MLNIETAQVCCRHLPIVQFHCQILNEWQLAPVDLPLRPTANRFGGCFCLGSGPVFRLYCFLAVCFTVSAGETQVWLGDLRVVAFCVVVVFVLLLLSIC